MKTLPYILLFLLAVGSLGLASCRKDPKVTPEGVELISDADIDQKSSFYLLNEGNMNMNRASLDFFDAGNSLYRRNIFEALNPEVTRGLGDVGNDIKVYGSKLYVLVNLSNKIEVLDARTGKRLSQIDFPNGRYITFHEGKAYASSYRSRKGEDNSANGYVAQIDTASLRVERTVTVGRQPEEMAVAGNKLYVANSGGYNPEQFERSLSVIDLQSFTEVKRIDVAINLHRVKADRYGDLYVTSRGDNYQIPSKLFVIDTRTEKIKTSFDFVVSNLWIDGDRAYIVGLNETYLPSADKASYTLLDLQTETILSDNFISDGTQEQISRPYGIAVDPLTKDIYVGDAKDNITPGTLYCFDRQGRRKWSVITGDIPAHFAFIH